MSKRVLNIAVIGLLVINMLTLGMLWMKSSTMNGPHNHPRGIVQQLDFTAEQQEQFRRIKKEHFERVHSIKGETQLLRQEYVDLLKQHADDQARVEQIVNQIGENVARIETLTFQHFKDIQDLCDDRQKEKFDDLLDEMARMLLTGPPPPPPGGGHPPHPPHGRPH